MPKLILFSALILLIGPLSPLINFFLPIAGKFFLFLSVCLALLMHIIYKFDYSRAYFLIGITLCSAILLCLQGILRSDIRYLGIPLYFIPSFFIAASLNRNIIEKLVDYLSIIAIILSTGAVIGFVFCFVIGAPPIWSFLMPDNRESFLFFTTLTNAYFRTFNIIRPSGIFDEPGTLSFFLCFVVIMRELLGRKGPLTVVILSLGLITFSLAHTAFYFIYLLHKKQWIICITIALSTGVLITYVSNNENLKAIDTIFLSRMSDDDALNENARSQMLLNAKNALSLSVAFFGTKEDGTFNKKLVDDVHGRMGENPLSPLVYHGLIGSWLFYLTLILLIIFAITNSECALIYIGYLALLLQRPYSLYLGYSLMTAIILFAKQIQRRDLFEGDVCRIAVSKPDNFDQNC